VSMVCPNGHTSDADDYCDTCGAELDASAQPSAGGSAGGGAGGGAGGAGSSYGSFSGAGASAGGAVPATGGPEPQTCPNCHSSSAHDSLFCEACGYDFTTGAMPRGFEAPAAEASVSAGGPSATEPASSPAASLTADPSGPDAAPDAGLALDPAAMPVVGAGAAPAAATGIPPAIVVEWVAEVWIDPEWYAVQEAEEPMPSPGLPVVVPLAVRSALIGRVSTSKHITPDIDCMQDSGVSRRHAQLTTDGTRWFVEDLGSANGTFVGAAFGALPEDPIEVGPKRELGDGDRIYVGAWTRIVVRKATPEEVEAAAS
jgi:hypothetical protein